MTASAGFALARILAGAYGLGTLVFFLGSSERTVADAVVRNGLDDADQRSLALCLVAALLAGVAYAALAWRRGRTDALVDASWEPLALAPLALVPLWSAPIPAWLRVLAIAAIAGGVGIALALVATRSPRAAWLEVLEAPRTARVVGIAACTGALAHAVVLARQSIENYRVLYSGWDLAIYSQVHWNITTTLVPWSSQYSDELLDHYAIHFSPIYHLTSLVYALHRSPATLLALENVAIGLGAIPLFLLARRLTDRTSAAICLVVSYVVNPCTHSLGLYDFHEIVFFVPLMLALLWAIHAERTRAIWVLVALTLAIREDTPAYVAMLAAYLWLDGRRALAKRLALVSVGYLLLVHGAVMPLLRGGRGYMFDDRFAGLWRGTHHDKGTMIATLLTNPAYVLRYMLGDGAKWEFVALVLLPVAFLPLAARRAAVLLVPGLAFSLLSAFAAQYDIGFHYTAPILPFLYFAAIVAIARTTPRLRIPLAGAVIVASLLLSAKHGRSPLLNPPLVRAEQALRAGVYGERAPAIHAAAARIPKDACVRATGNLLPAVSERLRSYILPFGKDCPYALIDYVPEARHAPSTFADERTYLLERTQSGAYGVTYLDERVVLIARGAPTERNGELVARLEGLR